MSTTSALALWPQTWQTPAAERVHYDYCLLPYAPEQTTAHDLLSVNVLRLSWQLHGVLQEGEALLARLRAGLGADQVVWGIKHRHDDANSVSWELYFYRRAHNPPEYTLTRVQQLFAPIAVEGAIAAHWPWLMFSVELDIHQLRGERPSTASVYIHSAGTSYKLRADAPPELENHYLFRDPLSGIDDILERLRVSVHVPAQPQALARLLPPQLQHCLHICVANKRWADAVYWSRIDIRQLLHFMRSHTWPPTLLSHIMEHQEQYQHLRWDIGTDFQTDTAQRELMFIKSGLYGTY